MPFNALLLPLIGGFYFVFFTHLTSYWASRQQRENSLFVCCFFGALFLGVARLLTFTTSLVLPDLGSGFRGIVPFPWAGTSHLALVLGVSSSFALNKWVSRDKAADINYKRGVMNALESLFYYSSIECSRRSSGPKKVSITLKDNKVYIGLIVWAPRIARADDVFIRVLPLASGYRDKDTQKLHIKVNYAELYERVMQSSSEAEIDSFRVDYSKVIPVSEIKSASVYLDSAWQYFQEKDHH